MNDQSPKDHSARDLQILIDKIAATNSSIAFRHTRSDGANRIVAGLKSTNIEIHKISNDAVNVFEYLSTDSQELLISDLSLFFKLLEDLSLKNDNDYLAAVLKINNASEIYYKPLVPLLGEIVAARHAKAIEQQAANKLQEAEKTLDNAIHKEDAATDTARGVSLQGAQEIFKSAASAHNYRALLWGIWSAVAFAIFFGILVGFYDAKPPKAPGWEVVYFTSLRLATLGAIGTVAALFVTQTKAHLHMREHNLHRMRIANSAPALLAAVIEDAQKDQILAQLVDALTHFGQSGILGGKGDQGDIGGGLQRIIQISSPKGD